MERPLILISNDDSIYARGLHELVNLLQPLGDIVVVAPDAPRSGAAGSLTVNRPLFVSKVEERAGVTLYKCSGTPTDCVKLALHDIVPRRPDLVIGGINHGDNSAVNVHYSGTLGVVLEGCMKGIPSIGFSLCDHDPNANFAPMLPYVKQITSEVLTHGLPTGVCLNVNAPKVDELKGVKVCRQTVGMWEHEFAKCEHPRTGQTYYWLTGDFASHDAGTDCDHWALTHGYVAITPVKVDVTAYEAIEAMNSWDLTK